MDVKSLSGGTRSKSASRLEVKCSICLTAVDSPQYCTNCTANLCKICWNHSFQYHGAFTDEHENTVKPFIQKCHSCTPLTNPLHPPSRKTKRSLSH